METLCHLIVTNKLETCTITIQNPLNTSETLDLELALKNNTKNAVNIIHGSPLIKSNIHLKAKIYDIDENSNYSDKEILNKIKVEAESYLKNEIKRYLYRTSKDLRSDIDNFNGIAIRKFKTWDDWQKYDWTKNYGDAFFNVDVKLDLKSSHILLSS